MMILWACLFCGETQRPRPLPGGSAECVGCGRTLKG